ncbi:uncharacterized protein LOC131624939 [Vicia villosa]|uniref:uncharacterized protein LOC131624939 n=1 Tax=Vicia villosa TaxID=3911 RepID=UPI00273CDB61|nr:uncharacterized protein LOC131624939 [Vicia villosa]
MYIESADASLNSFAIYFGDASSKLFVLSTKVVVSNDTKHDEVKDDVKPDEVNDDVKPDQVKDDVRPVDVEIDVGQQFTNEKLFTVREHILEWVCMVVGNLGFNTVIGRSDNDDTWKFNVISDLHNHALQSKLAGHPIVRRLKPEEKEIVSDMSLVSVAPKNILAYLKRKRPVSVSNIKQVYNARYLNNTAIRGPRSKMQQLLKLLDDNHYVSRYTVCEDKVCKIQSNPSLV